MRKKGFQCPIIDTFSGKKSQSMPDLDGKLLDRLESAIPMLATWRRENDCPVFWRVFALGFWAGFLFMQIKEKKRHFQDVDAISADIRNLEALTGLTVNELEVPADLWVEVPESPR